MDGLSSDDELSPKEQAHATSAKKEVMEQAKRWEDTCRINSLVILYTSYLAIYGVFLTYTTLKVFECFFSKEKVLNFQTAPNPPPP